MGVGLYVGVCGALCRCVCGALCRCVRVLGGGGGFM